METNGRHLGRGDGNVITDDDNVVRLPREWLGPPGQLVPFAEDDSVPQLETPGSTHDFWGEALADDLSARVEPGDAGSRARVRRAFRWPSFARAGDEAGRARRAPPRAVLGAAAVLVIVALAIGNSGAPSALPRGSASASIHRAGASSGPVAFVPHGTLASAPARSSGTIRRHPVPRPRPATPRHVLHRAVPAHTATVEPVRYSTVSPTTSTYSSNSVPPASASASSSAAATATGASAGSHQPATGATGALGPGSSPDG